MRSNVRLQSKVCRYTYYTVKSSGHWPVNFSIFSSLSLSLYICIQKLFTSQYAYYYVGIDHFFPPVWLSLPRTTSDNCSLSTSKDMINKTHHIYNIIIYIYVLKNCLYGSIWRAHTSYRLIKLVMGSTSPRIIYSAIYVSI